MRIGVLGGSFNPVHIGHIRLAIEARERLGLDRVDLAPCSQPPHKPAAGLLDFALRRQLLELALAPAQGLPRLDWLAINDLEARRAGPSYTYDTLRSYQQTEPGSRVCFLLGGGDLLTLPEWRHGQELVRLADFVVVPRDEHELADIEAFVAVNWPDATLAPAPPFAAAWTFAAAVGAGGATTQLAYLPLPRLDISSSRVRAAWRARASLRCLVPEAVERELLARQAEVDKVWGAE